MSKVIEALQGSHNAVLESPTGTGKTLCLLCASLAWLLSKKAQVQACNENNCLNNMEEQVFDELNAASGTSGVACSVPKIIYDSITHSQLTQVMREMKRTTYSYMKTAIIGSRDQLCIHPDVINKSGTANKIQMCRAKVLSNACSFFAGVEQISRIWSELEIRISVVRILCQNTRSNERTLFSCPTITCWIQRREKRTILNCIIRLSFSMRHIMWEKCVRNQLRFS